VDGRGAAPAECRFGFMGTIMLPSPIRTVPVATLCIPRVAQDAIARFTGARG